MWAVTKEVINEELPLTFHQIQHRQGDLTHVIKISTRHHFTSGQFHLELMLNV